MKKLFFALLVIFSTHLAATDGVGFLEAKMILEDSKAYFILSGGQYWKVVPFVKRSRTLVEWISSEELYVPEAYQSNFDQWPLGEEIEIYPKTGNLRVNESFASNIEELKECTHFLVDRRTEAVFFAKYLQPTDCLVEIYNDGVRHGYADGHDKGYNTGYRAGYNDGFSDGEQ
ncbi:MAG: hypothetical protein V4487_06730 [Chlamydiota bacterium]